MPFGQPVFIFLCASVGAVVVVLTAPVWTRLVKTCWKAVMHQVREGADVLDQPDTSPEQTEERTR